jgi:GT2 family glycosyltransferase
MAEFSSLTSKLLVPLDVIIVHWQRPEDCIKTITAFRNQPIPVRVKIVDNGSPPDIVALLQGRLGDDVEWMPLARNIGFGPAMNVGLRRWLGEGTGDYVVLAPHDALPQPGCLEHILSEMQIRPLAGIGCAEYGEPRKPGYHWLKGPIQVRAKRGDGWESVSYPNGNLMIFRRACLEQIGLFDERYYAYTEEYEIALRARQAGWDVGIVWGAVVRNPIRAACSRITWYLLIRNNLLAVYQTSGVISASLLSLRLLIAGGHRALFSPASRNEGDYSGVRWRAIRDFWCNRLGPPPEDITPT